MSPGSYPESEFPERLGRYEVLLPIASGGMGRVFLACSTAMGGFEREVAVKITHEHLKDNLQFFTALIDEARLAGRIRHPHVVSVLDVGDAPDGVFIVMDYVEGESLAGVRQLLAPHGGQLPLEVSLRVLDDVLSGLHAAHELTDADGRPLEVVHRDVTPSNVLVGIDGIARITDFGVAKAASRLTKTVTGVVKGKISYMAPEQARTGPIDRTCDVWAVGVMAWELFSSMRLHEGLNDFALMLKVTREPPPRLRHIRPDLPAALDEAVAGALRMNPADRYPTAEVFAEVLAAAARDAGITPATARGVKAFVGPLVLPAIEVRREQAAKIRRARFGRSSGDLNQSSGQNRSRPSHDRPSVPSSVPAKSAPSQRRVESPTVTESLGPTIPSTPDHTESVSAVAPSVPPQSAPPQPGRARALLALGVALALAISAAVMATVRSPSTRAPARSAAPSAAPVTSMSEPPIITPSELPVETEADGSAISPSELKLEPSAAPAPPHRPGSWALPHPTTPPPVGPSNVQPEPRANPYKKH